MSIGQDLSRARQRAGLSIAEVSQRTRIRETIIQDIERDDFAGCGGDFYARGHIRAIAAAVGVDADPLIAEYDLAAPAGDELTAAEAFRPVLPLPTRERRRPNWTAILALALLVAAGVGAYLLFSGSGQAPGATASGHRKPVTHHHGASASARPTPSASPAPTTRAAGAALVRVLRPASIAAFGPGGVSQGDSPQLARLAIDSRPGTAWRSDWYATPAFGNLQSGTGLLLAMGKTVTITSAKIRLGSTPGADIRLRVGTKPVLADLHRIARADNAGGLLRLRASRLIRARYVLVWFTRLPPDGAGTFRVSVFNIRLNGHR
jgi:transcriptional regulator with XRE-family HTH domain